MKAVVFVDVQKDFIDGALRNEKAIEVTPKIVEFAKDCATNGVCKFYATRDTHEKTVCLCEPSDDGIHGKVISSEGYLSTLEGKKLPVEHCIEGTEGWMIDNRLMEVINGRCTFVNKPTFGSFDLVEIIKEDFTYEKNDEAEHFHSEDLDEIILVGFCTDICVISNALLLRAKFPNTKITVMSDLCAGVTEETHAAALKTMNSCQIDIL